MSKKRKAKTPKRIYFVVSDECGDDAQDCDVFHKKPEAKHHARICNNLHGLANDHRIVTYERKP